MEKVWGIWIPKLGVWLEDHGRVPYTTTLRREAADWIKKWAVNPKGYEVKEYVEAVPDAGDGIGSTFTATG